MKWGKKGVEQNSERMPMELKPGFVSRIKIKRDIIPSCPSSSTVVPASSCLYSFLRDRLLRPR